MVELFEISQGDILSVDKLTFPVMVVSKNFFNRSEQVIACPVTKNAAPDPLHIKVNLTPDEEVYVLCEQIKLLDLRIRGFKKINEAGMESIMDITDAIQGIFDYYPYS